MTRKQGQIRYERQKYTYVELHHCAEWSIKQADPSGAGSFYNAMSAMIFCAFCIEAYLNHVGSELFDYWEDHLDRLGPMGKLRLVCEKLEVDADFSRMPFQAASVLFRYRDALAHGKTKTIEKESHHEILTPGWVRDLATDWENQTRIEEARKLFNATEAMITEIHKAAGLGERPFIVIEAGGTSAG
jgi:hypothetical protein